MDESDKELVAASAFDRIEPLEAAFAEFVQIGFDADHLLVIAASESEYWRAALTELVRTIEGVEIRPNVALVDQRMKVETTIPATPGLQVAGLEIPGFGLRGTKRISAELTHQIGEGSAVLFAKTIDPDLVQIASRILLRHSTERLLIY